VSVRFRRTLLLGAALNASIALSGCSSSDGGAGSTPDAGAVAFAGCSPSKAIAASKVQAREGTYEPACVQIARGSSLTIEANMMHPLQGMTEHGDTPNPIAEGEPATGYLQDLTVSFPNPGAFGFFCNVHGSDTSAAGSMTGVVYVQ
jgi:plastocyanin